MKYEWRPCKPFLVPGSAVPMAASQCTGAAAAASPCFTFHRDALLINGRTLLAWDPLPLWPTSSQFAFASEFSRVTVQGVVVKGCICMTAPCVPAFGAMADINFVDMEVVAAATCIHAGERRIAEGVDRILLLLLLFLHRSPTLDRLLFQLPPGVLKQLRARSPSVGADHVPTSPAPAASTTHSAKRQRIEEHPCLWRAVPMLVQGRRRGLLFPCCSLHGLRQAKYALTSSMEHLALPLSKGCTSLA